MMGFLMDLSLLNRLSLAAGLLAALGVVYGLWHHTVYKSGELACKATYEAVAAAQKNKAQKEITNVGVKYAQIDMDLQKNSGFADPVSHLVADAIGRMPQPAKHGFQ